MFKAKYDLWLTPEGLLLLAGWVREGLSEERIAKKMGIHPSTLRRWKERYPAIELTMRVGGELADCQVEGALLRAACGYEYQEETREPLLWDGEPVLGEDGEPRTRVVKIVTKYAHPNLTAASFWLRNRRAGMWRDRPESPAEESREASNLLEAIQGAAAGAFAGSGETGEEMDPDGCVKD